jgi:histidinol-phosphate aminotransferase
VKNKKCLNEVTPYEVPTYSRMGKIRLDLNENIGGCSPKVIEAIRNFQPGKVGIYPEYSELTDRLAQEFKIPSESILITNGADEAIRIVFETYIENNDKVLLPIPIYSMYEIFAKMMGSEIVTVLYNKDFSFPIDQLLKSVTSDTKLILIINPSSPIGTSVEEEDLLKILDRANDKIVLLDETYYHFANKTYAGWIKEFKNLIVIQTFSKAYGLAGLRLGVLISDIENINNLKKVKPPYSVNAIAVAAGIAALEDKRYVKSVIQNIISEKGFIVRELTQLGFDARLTKTNFILVNFGKLAEKVYQKLLEQNILVKNISKLPLMNGYLRITVGMRRESQLLLEALKNMILPEVILFDMDGVLVDVSKSYRLAIKKTVESFSDREVTFEEIEAYKNRGGYNNDWDITEAILKDIGISVSCNQIVQVFQQYYLGNNFNGFIANEKWLLEEGILNKLKQTYKLGIVTGRPRMEAEYSLKKEGIDKDFDVLITMEDVGGRDKPDPYGIDLALKKLQAKRAVFIGDNIDDIKAALNARITPIGVVPPHTNGEKTAKILRESGAKCILKNVNEITEVLRNEGSKY